MPQSLASGSPTSLAFRSHSAASIAAIAIETIPGRPRFRIARRIATQLPGTSIASRPSSSGASFFSASSAVAVSAYVYPSPRSPPPGTSTTTIVVAFHSSVPSDSGPSVGIVYAATSARPSFAHARISTLDAGHDLRNPPQPLPYHPHVPAGPPLRLAPAPAQARFHRHRRRYPRARHRRQHRHLQHRQHRPARPASLPSAQSPRHPARIRPRVQPQLGLLPQFPRLAAP